MLASIIESKGRKTIPEYVHGLLYAKFIHFLFGELQIKLWVTA